MSAIGERMQAHIGVRALELASDSSNTWQDIRLQLEHECKAAILIARGTVVAYQREHKPTHGCNATGLYE